MSCGRRREGGKRMLANKRKEGKNAKYIKREWSLLSYHCKKTFEYVKNKEWLFILYTLGICIPKEDLAFPEAFCYSMQQTKVPQQSLSQTSLNSEHQNRCHTQLPATIPF